MVPLFIKSRRSFVAGVVALAPLVLASACSDSPSGFFDPPMGGSGKGGSSSGGTGATAGSMSSGGASAGKSGTGGASSGGTGTGGTDTSGGMPGGGSGGDGSIAGTGGQDPGTGGSAGTDAMAGEGGMGEGGMGGGASGSAGTGGSAGTSGMGGDGGTAGTSNAGTAGSATGGAGTSAGGSAGTSAGGTSGSAGTNSGGTGGASCTPTAEICDGVDNDCGEDVDEGGVCPNGCHGGTFKGQTYLLCTSNNELEWEEAREFCMDADDGSGNVEVAGPMTLVEINSAEENQFLVDWIKADGITESVWHGANDRDDRSGEGRWTWDRGDGNEVLFYTVTITGMRMAVNGAYHDWPAMQPGYAGTASANVGDCGTFDEELDFRWDDRACTQAPLDSFICGQIP